MNSVKLGFEYDSPYPIYYFENNYSSLKVSIISSSTLKITSSIFKVSCKDKEIEYLTSSRMFFHQNHQK